MQLKTILLSVVMIAVAGVVSAQDKIYKRDGEVIDSKIKSVGVKTITYTRFDNQSGPEYTIIKSEVSKIKYENGTEDNIEEDRPGPHRPMRHRRTDTKDDVAEPKIKYGPNVLAIAPVQFSENGLGVSLSYERALDKAGVIAFYLPLIATFNLNNGSFVNAAGATQNGHTDMMTYIMPGIKLYPTGALGRVKYSVGPSLVYATGEKSTQLTDFNGATYEVTNTHTMLGLIINNGLNINPSKHVYLGLELGLGFTYFNRVDGINQDTKGLVQGAFKIGYRF